MRRLPRPKPRRLTPIQRACAHLGEAVRAAREDERAAETFASILAVAAARENARLLEREVRP